MDNIEETLIDLPDQVADALSAWRIATLNREKKEALLYVEIKGQDEKRTAAEIKAIVHGNAERYNLVLLEITSEAQYIRLYERLLSAKKRASLRTAF